jgi:hypothetical protein
MRGGQNVFKRILAVALVCATAGVAAQQTEPQSQANAPDPQLERTRNEVRTFEMVLLRSIETAGQKLAAWAETKVPNVIIVPAADPIVNGVPVGGENLVFMVRIPELSGLPVFNRAKIFQQPPGVGVPTQNDSKPGAQMVNSTGVVPDDPMKGNANPPDPHAMYSDFVRFGLMDAMIDSSTVLTLKDGQWLSVVAIPVDVLVTNPYYRNTSRKLVLSIKGEDLTAFRAGKITRDELKLKIVDTRF